MILQIPTVSYPVSGVAGLCAGERPGNSLTCNRTKLGDLLSDSLSAWRCRIASLGTALAERRAASAAPPSAFVARRSLPAARHDWPGLSAEWDHRRSVRFLPARRSLAGRHRGALSGAEPCAGGPDSGKRAAGSQRPPSRLASARDAAALSRRQAYPAAPRRALSGAALFSR